MLLVNIVTVNILTIENKWGVLLIFEQKIFYSIGVVVPVVITLVVVLFLLGVLVIIIIIVLVKVKMKKKVKPLIGFTI